MLALADLFLWLLGEWAIVDGYTTACAPRIETESPQRLSMMYRSIRNFLRHTITVYVYSGEELQWIQGALIAIKNYKLKIDQG